MTQPLETSPYFYPLVPCLLKSYKTNLISLLHENSIIIWRQIFLFSLLPHIKPSISISIQFNQLLLATYQVLGIRLASKDTRANEPWILSLKECPALQGRQLCKQVITVLKIITVLKSAKIKHIQDKVWSNKHKVNSTDPACLFKILCFH